MTGCRNFLASHWQVSRYRADSPYSSKCLGSVMDLRRSGHPAPRTARTPRRMGARGMEQHQAVKEHGLDRRIWIVSWLCVACSAGSPLPSRRTTDTVPGLGVAGGSAGDVALPNLGGAPSTPADTPAAPPASAAPAPATDTMLLNGGEVCDAQAYSTQRTPLDIYMMLDASASMIPWWPSTLDSLGQFFADPSSTGIAVGLQLFGTVCEVEHYSTPAVPIDTLPGNAARLNAAFPLIPTDETATLPALKGAIVHARQWAGQHPDHKVVVMLVTDGLPEECDSTVENVTQAAREGFQGTPAIQTFVVGIGDVTAIDQFAAAGGTQKALLTSPGTAAELVQALNQVRNKALPCEFQLPNGSSVQPGLVNLRYTSDTRDTARAPRTIGAVQNAAHCDAVQGGWYFDDASAPTRVIVCDESCEQLHTGGEVKVLLGCPTQVIAPS